MMLYGKHEATDLTAKEMKILRIAMELELKERKQAAHRGAVRRVR